MKSLFTFLFTAIVSITLNAQEPHLTSVNPKKIYTQSTPTIVSITLNGNNMWPNYLTISMAREVMQIHLSKGGKDQGYMMNGISSNSQSLQFSSAGWLETPGQLEVYITIAAFSGRPAYRSNSLYIQVESVPASAPVINNIAPATFKASTEPEKYMFRVYGKNFGERSTTSVSINGLNGPIGWAHLEDGVIDVWVPSTIYAKDGSYPVTVKTKFGTSNAATLKIEGNKTTIVSSTPVNKPLGKITPVQNQNNSTPIIKSEVKPVVIAKAINPDNAARLNTELVKGARVTIIGTVTDASSSAALENFISNLENVLVVDNKIEMGTSSGNLQAKITAAGIDNTAVQKIKASIESKARELNLGISVN